MARSFSSAALLAWVLVAAWLSLATDPASACIHRYNKKDSPQVADANNAQAYVDGLTSRDNEPPHPEELEKLYLLSTGGGFRERSDYAAALILNHDLSRAIEIFHEVEGQQHGEYIVALNLGTAYELAGDNANALKWITTGVRRTPQTRDEGEWVHIRILEAKIAHADDPDWFRSHSIVGLEVGTDRVPVKPTRAIVDPHGQPKTLPDVRAALEYQLRERMSLVKAPDPVVSSLLADLGNLLVLEGKPAYAAPVYRLALEYDPEGNELLQHRSFAAEKAANWIGNLDDWAGWIPEVLVAGLIVGIVVAIGIYTRQFLRKPRQSAVGTG